MLWFIQSTPGCVYLKRNLGTVNNIKGAISCKCFFIYLSRISWKIKTNLSANVNKLNEIQYSYININKNKFYDSVKGKVKENYDPEYEQESVNTNYWFQLFQTTSSKSVPRPANQPSLNLLSQAKDFLWPVNSQESGYLKQIVSNLDLGAHTAGTSTPSTCIYVREVSPTVVLTSLSYSVQRIVLYIWGRSLVFTKRITKTRQPAINLGLRPSTW